MRRGKATVGSAIHFVAAPAVVACLVPWWLTGWQMADPPWAVRVVGVLLIVAGVSALLYSVARFVLDGRGTPAPVAPTERLVVGGLYRYARNPMYLAVTAVIAGQALLLGRHILLAYAALIVAMSVAFVRLYEEPSLARQFGAEYEAYRRSVPGWWPRLGRQ